MKSIKMIAMDLDDTLLDRNLLVSERNRQALRQASQAGITIVLASGRPTAGMRAVADSIGLDSDRAWLVSFNGGCISDWSGQTPVWQEGFSKSEGLDILQLAQTEGLGFLSYDAQGIITPQANQWTQEEARLTGLNVTVYSDLSNHLPALLPKAILLGEPLILARKAIELRERFGMRWNISLSKPFFLEFTPFGVEKGSALNRLAAHIGLAPSECLAIGDGHNDLTMIEWAGIGVAVANAVQKLKDAADWISPHHDEDAIAHTLERFAFI